MIALPSFNMLAVLLFIGVTYSAVIPEKDRFRHEDWAENYNLVEPPPAVLLFSHVFDHSKSKITPQNRLKSVIKALYQYDTMNNVRKVNDKEVINSEYSSEFKSSTLSPEEKKLIEVDSHPFVETEFVLSTKSNERNEKIDDIVKGDQVKDVSSTEEQINAQGTTEIDIQPTEQTTQKLEILLEDFVDSIIHVPAHMEGDKAQKFTHSIRYGYGVPFHYNGL